MAFVVRGGACVIEYGMSPRDHRIDFLRGLALLMIFIDHVPADILSLITLRSYAFADAAELFFFISGYIAALVYGGVLRRRGFAAAALRIYRRGAQIYAAQIVLLVLLVIGVALAGVALDRPWLLDHFGLETFAAHPGPTLIPALLLRYQPTYLDILPVYVVLFAILPFLLALLARDLWRTLGLSFALYLGVQVWGWSPHTYPDGGVWYFNPFAWQFLFVLGAAFTRPELLRLRALLQSRRFLVPALIAVSVIAVLSFSAALHGFFGTVPSLYVFDLPAVKASLQPLRIVSFLLLAALGWRFLPDGERLHRHAAARAVMNCGRHALVIFAAGVLLAAVGEICWQVAPSYGLQALIGAGGTGLLLALAALLRHLATQRRLQAASARI